MPKRDPAKLMRVSLSLPFGMGKAEWESDPAERRAAWSLYVDLITRVAVQEPPGDYWLFRETLNSLYTIFESTRLVLREGGPDLGRSTNSVAGLAIGVLNVGLRPFLSRWHPALLEWESKQTPEIGGRAHERNWPDAADFMSGLDVLREELRKYALALAAIAGIEPELLGDFNQRQSEPA